MRSETSMMFLAKGMAQITTLHLRHGANSVAESIHKIRLLAVVALFVFVTSCGKHLDVRSPAFYAGKLGDTKFRWLGPTSVEDRIPRDHAARALAFIGDPAVPYLLNAIDREDLDIVSIYDALSEIGLPVSDFENEIVHRRDSSGIREWWQEHAGSTRAFRSKHRRAIGLPELNDSSVTHGSGASC
jgi:hypothetical protein